MPRIYTLCSCRHNDDHHQSLRADFTPLDDQRICYGDEGTCECQGWRAAAQCYNYRMVLEQPTLIDAFHVMNREGKWIEWV